MPCISRSEYVNLQREARSAAEGLCSCERLLKLGGHRISRGEGCRGLGHRGEALAHRALLFSREGADYRPISSLVFDGTLVSLNDRFLHNKHIRLDEYELLSQSHKERSQFSVARRHVEGIENGGRIPPRDKIAREIRSDVRCRASPSQPVILASGLVSSAVCTVIPASDETPRHQWAGACWPRKATLFA